MKHPNSGLATLLGACLLVFASCGEDKSDYVDPCSTDPCSGHGACDEGNCTCDAGYAGISCGTCATGYTGFPDCRPADPLCERVNCIFGECSAGTCVCDQGYTGTVCAECAAGYTGYPQCTPQ